MYKKEPSKLFNQFRVFNTVFTHVYLKHVEQLIMWLSFFILAKIDLEHSICLRNKNKRQPPRE